MIGHDLRVCACVTVCVCVCVCAPIFVLFVPLTTNTGRQCSDRQTEARTKSVSESTTSRKDKTSRHKAWIVSHHQGTLTLTKPAIDRHLRSLNLSHTHVHPNTHKPLRYIHPGMDRFYSFHVSHPPIHTPQEDKLNSATRTMMLG